MSNRTQASAKARGALVVVQIPLAASVAYLVALLGAAVGSRYRRPVLGPGTMQLLVVIPAHDEEAGIARALRAIHRADYPADRRTVVVIADNCSDATADIARRHGAVVLERLDSQRPGKGWALAASLPKLLAAHPSTEAVVLVDADCEVSSNILRVLEQRLLHGADAVQAADVVTNADDSPVAALRAAAFALTGTVRPLGRQRLGLSCGLQGTGMALSRALLESEPWSATGLAEDAEYHARIVLAGRRADFAAEAAVHSQMPARLDSSHGQQARWEAGKLSVIRSCATPLIGRGVRNADPRAAFCAIDMLVPPLSMLLLANVAAAVLAVGANARLALRIAVLDTIGVGVFVLGGMRVADASPAAYRALALAPAFMIRKLSLYARLASGWRPRTWQRTSRTAAAGGITALEVLHAAADRSVESEHNSGGRAVPIQ